MPQYPAKLSEQEKADVLKLFILLQEVRESGKIKDRTGTNWTNKWETVAHSGKATCQLNNRFSSDHHYHRRHRKKGSDSDKFARDVPTRGDGWCSSNIAKEKDGELMVKVALKTHKKHVSTERKGKMFLMLLLRHYTAA